MSDVIATESRDLTVSRTDAQYQSMPDGRRRLTLLAEDGSPEQVVNWSTDDPVISAAKVGDTVRVTVELLWGAASEPQ